MIVSILIMSLLSILFISACSSSNGNEQKMGNTNANIVNGGSSVMRDDWIYFMNFSDSNFLYKIKNDGTGETKVCDDTAYYLNSYGDWIYYCNGSENGRLYKIRPDGTERTMVSDTASINILVSNDWIYFIDYTDAENASDYGKIFRMKADGSGKEKINDAAASAFNISSDWVYYISQNELKLYKVKVDGTGNTKVSDASISFFNILGDKIYYVDSSDEKNNIWKMKTDGTDAVRLSEDKATTFNVSGEWIYYGNTLSDTAGVELKKMRIDGSEAAVMNDDDSISINVHGDWLVYLSMDFTDFSVKQTIMKVDGTGRKDYLYKQTPEAQDTERYPMGEAVKAGDIAVTVNSVYATNIMENNQPGFESVIFDDVTDGRYLFINMTITNLSDTETDIWHMTGVVEDIEAMGLTIYWGPLADVTGEPESGNIKFHLALDVYNESLLLKPGETKEIQAYYQMQLMNYPVYLGLFDSANSKILAAIELFPTEEFYVTSWASALDILEERFPGYEINQLNGMGFQFEGEEEEKMYYSFKVTKSGSAEAEYYLVERDTGEIFIGAYSEKYPDYEAVPVSPFVATSITPSPTESGDIPSNAQILTGTFQGIEWGDYMHISIRGDDGVDYSFFVLHSIGMDPETLAIGQAVKVTWQNSDVFLDPPGETINIDQIIGMELLGSTP